MSDARAPDPAGLRYARHWEPVLAAPGARLLERVASLLEPSTAASTPAVVLDLGTGTGSLALAAARRWRGARIVGLDASAAMLSVARDRTADGGAPDGPGCFEWIVADAAAMPLADASVDIVLCAFMLQLASDRRAVLHEVGRVLRPGGPLGIVTWLADELALAPDLEFDEAVYDLGLEDPGVEAEAPPPDDIADVATLRAELDTAGFTAVDARPDRLEFGWSRGEYLDLKEGYDEWDLVDSLSSRDRSRLRERLVERWAALPDEAFTLRAPLVAATARRPDGGSVAAHRPQAANGEASRGRQTRQGR
jgi:SAM-dependent methyltransferase